VEFVDLFFVDTVTVSNAVTVSGLAPKILSRTLSVFNLRKWDAQLSL